MRNSSAGRWPDPPRVGAAVAQFVLGSLAAIAVIVVGGFFALRSVAIAEATRDTTDRVRAEARLVEAAGLDAGITKGDPAAIRRLDDLVRNRILGDSIIRVKLWTQDGTILYSDEPELIGQRYSLGEEDLELFEHPGGAEAELSDLDRPENRYERGQGKLLEAYTTLQAPDGTPLLFEDVPAVQLDRRQRRAVVACTVATVDRRDGGSAAAPGPAGLDDGAAAPARPSGTRTVARERDRRIDS